MRKFLTPLLLLLFVFLSACGTNNEPEPTPTNPPEPTVEIVEPATEIVADPVEVQTSEAVCVVQPPVEDLLQENDWVEGLEVGYSVTIIEYGDYQ